MSTLRDYDGGDFDLAIGEIYGLRVWAIDGYGRLRARYLTEVAAPWRPGVNTAHCHAEPTTPGGIFIGASGGMVVGRLVTGAMRKCTCSSCRAAATAGVEQKEPETPETPAHSAPSEDCTCGFYAYTGVGDEVWSHGGLVVGVIRGTGRTLIGAKGFRCEKAEIIAILDPSAETAPQPLRQWQRDRLRAVYPDVPLLGSRAQLLDFAPIDWTTLDPTSDDFWNAP